MRVCKYICALLIAGITTFVRADLVSCQGNWTGLASQNFTFNGVQYTLSATDTAFCVDIPAGTKTWIFSSKGTTGDFYPVLVAQTTGGAVHVGEFTAFHTFGGSGVNPIIWWTDLSSLSSYAVVTVTFAHRTSGGTMYANEELHAVGSSVADYNEILAADNDPTSKTTFYAGSVDGGLQNLIQKCNNGTWVNVGTGVDCSICLGPYVNQIIVNSTGTVVTVRGNFGQGYNQSGVSPLAVYCSNWGELYWHVNGASSGYWSTSP